MDSAVLDKYIKAGKIASKVRDEASSMIKEGVTLLEIAEFAEAEIVRLGGTPAFPVNISIDSQAAHFTPHSKDKLKFKAGNLVKLDLGVHVGGYIADTATTVEVGGNRWDEMKKAAEDALDAAIDAAKPGAKVSQLGAVIEGVINSRGYMPVSNLSGHLLEKFNLHAGLSIPNVNDHSTGELKKGMAVAVEPFATNGAGRVAGKKSGNIFRQFREQGHSDPEINEAIEFVVSEFKGLPFSERSMAKRFRNPDKILRRLLRYGVIATYPILKDAKGGMVSQAEHTIIITDTGCKITTK